MDGRRLRSHIVHSGLIRCLARTFLRALGEDEEDIERPHVGLFHTGGEMSPCNMGLRDQALHAKTGIYAGGGMEEYLELKSMMGAVA